MWLFLSKERGLLCPKVQVAADTPSTSPNFWNVRHVRDDWHHALIERLGRFTALVLPELDGLNP